MAEEKKSYRVSAGKENEIIGAIAEMGFEEGKDYMMVQNEFSGKTTFVTADPEIQSLLQAYHAKDLGPVKTIEVSIEREPVVYEVAENIPIDDLVKKLNNDDVPGATKFREGIHYSLDTSGERIRVIPMENEHGEQFSRFLNSQTKVSVQFVSATPEDKKKAKA